MVTAYIDESGGSGWDLENVYLLTASIPLCSDPDEYRNRLRGLKPADAAKLHWYRAGDGTKGSIMAAISVMEVLHVVVESVEPPSTNAERHRRLCMKLLLPRLDQMGVTSMVFESRGHSSNTKDRRMVAMMQVDGSISETVTVVHRDGPFEPLLWIPDAVCGAVSDRRIGKPLYLSTIDSNIDWMTRRG